MLPFFHFATVAAELLLHSIEQSLKLTLALGQVPTEELSKFDHDIHKLYKEVIGDHTREMDTKGEIVRITNIYTSRYGFTPVNEADIKGCINKHRSSYVSFRYFGVPKNFSSVPSWKLDWDDLRLLACLCPSLIEINICQATKSGIRVQPSLRQNGATKGINFTFKMAE